MSITPTDLPPSLQIPEHHQTIEHRQELLMTNTNDAPPEVSLRLHALRLAVESVAVVDRDRVFEKKNPRPTPGLLLDEAFTQADRIMVYFETGHWEPQPPPVVTVEALQAIAEEGK